MLEESLLFEVCCLHNCEQKSAAAKALSELGDMFPELTDAKESLAAYAVQQYALGASPTPRQHILRLCWQFCPEQLETLPAKLDGSNIAQQLEVLALLESKYGAVVADDKNGVAGSSTLQHVLLRNRALLQENLALRRQIEKGALNPESLQTFVDAHDVITNQLYTCMSGLRQLEKVNEDLKQELRAVTAERDGARSLEHNSTVSIGDSVAKLEKLYENERKELQSRIKALEKELLSAQAKHQETVAQLQNELEEQQQKTLSMVRRTTSLATVSSPVSIVRPNHSPKGFSPQREIELKERVVKHNDTEELQLEKIVSPVEKREVFCQTVEFSIANNSDSNNNDSNNVGMAQQLLLVQNQNEALRQRLVYANKVLQEYSSPSRLIQSVSPR